MNRINQICAAAVIATVGVAPYPAGAVVDAPDVGTFGTRDQSAPITGYRLDVEMTVHNWVLCASQPVAESLVRARQQGRDAAEKAYAQLASARSCGRLAEMQVILQKPVYDAPIDAGGRAGVYSALINVSGEWASGYVVFGGVPED